MGEAVHARHRRRAARLLGGHGDAADRALPGRDPRRLELVVPRSRPDGERDGPVGAVAAAPWPGRGPLARAGVSRADARRWPDGAELLGPARRLRDRVVAAEPVAG